MHSADIRARFLDFYRQRGHTVVASAPLVPDDPTLLFTNAGMVPFKDTFLGLERREYTRAVSSQKCMRVSGKHNDLENVGPSPRHHTFFEMLGNFSFGDYFKRDAIHYAWDFLTEAMAVPEDHLIATVHETDDEAFGVWDREIELPPERILRMGDKTNFWMMADVGPCGPTSELHYDFGPEHCTCGRPDCSVALDNDCGRWLEVWNLVFMQFDQAADGSRAPLPAPGVDTGMGLERICAVAQGVASNYDTDLFTPILARVQALIGHDEAGRRAHEVGYRVLADHGRAMTFLIADGVLPGNEGRNYVLRLIMRRAMRFGRLVGFDGPFLAEIVDAVVATMAAPYPELEGRAGWIREVVTEEEARFARTLAAGLEILDGVIGRAGEAGAPIPGAEVFRLYDTYGFPPDLTATVAEEHGLAIDRSGFDEAMAAQRARARAGAGFGVGAREDAYRRLDLDAVAFTGYESLAGEGRVVAVIADGANAGQVEVVLDRTPFYAEAGGQVGDTGHLVGPAGTVRVTDTQSPVPGVIVHVGAVESGALAEGDRVRAEVDALRRADIMRNHTATHLLHRALQEVLGEHAQQRGSLVAPDRLRFDFAHLRALTPDELTAVERRVNEMIRADAPVAWRLMRMDEARHIGATMLFGEKYGDVVRVVSVDGLSRELCGGTHLERTGQIGGFVVSGETSVGAGLRRIEALTGRGAEAFTRDRADRLEAVARRLGVTSVDAIEARLDELAARAREAAAELALARAALARAAAEALADQQVEVDGVPLVAARVSAPDAAALRAQADALRQRLGPTAVIVLGAVIDGAPRLVVTVPDALAAEGLHAGRLVNALAVEMGGRGGGRPTHAEAGGPEPGRLDAALAASADAVRAQRAGKG